MRKALLLFLALSAAGAQAQTIYPAGVPGCIAHWNFVTVPGSPTTLSDSSSYNHNGTTYNLTSVAGYRNRALQAMHFNGTSSSAQVPHDPQLNPQQISIMALIKFDGFYSGSCQTNNIIYKSVSYFTAGCWAMNVSDQDFDQSCSQFSPNYEALEFAGPSPAAGPVPPGNYVLVNQWYLFVETYNGDSLKRYQIAMDTVNWLTSVAPISITKIGASLGSNSSNITIGATQNATYPYNFNGDMDDIALYNRILNDSEVLAIYKYFRGPKPTSPTTAISSIGSEGSDPAIKNHHGSMEVINPAAGLPFRAALYDISGRKLSIATSIEKSIAFDTQDYAGQMLILQVENSKGVWRKKLVAF